MTGFITIATINIMMNKKETEIFKYVMKLYADNWNRNQYNRTNYDEDLEYYLGYRNENKYPLAYNEVFNRILPIVHTLLSKFMDQLYQTGNIVSVKPRKKKDLHRYKQVEAVLNFQLESLNDIDMQGGSYLTMMKWFFNALTFGKGIVKAYWKKEERIAPRRIALPKPNFDRLGNFQGMDVVDYISQEMQTIYDGPYVEVLHNKTFLPHPQYRSIQQMPAVFLIYKRSMDYLKKQEAKGIFKNIKEVPWEAGGGAGPYAKDSDEAFVKGLELEGGLQQEELNDERKSPDVDIIEGYTKLIFDEQPYEVGSGYKIKGREEEAIIHIANYKTIVSIQKNEYGIRPLFDIGCYMHPEMYWDLGLTRLTKGLQEQINTLGNLRMQNVMMMIDQMLRVDPDSDVDPEALVWKPFGIIPAMKDEVEPIVIPDMHSNLFMEQENFYEHTIQDLTGQYSYNMGQTPQRQERVGVVQCLANYGDESDYEILTDEGWKRFDDLNRHEKVMTLNFETDEMEWQNPTDYLDYPAEERELLHFKSSPAEFLCTMEHRIPVEREQRDGWRKEVVLADQLSKQSHAKIPLTGKWEGNDNWQVPFEGITQKDWAAFMGIWLSEGHTYYNPKQWSYQIGISQEASQDKIKQIDDLLKRLPVAFKYNGKQWKVQDKNLFKYLEKFGKSGDKFIPDELKNSSKKILQILLDWLWMGDGYYAPNGQPLYSSVSKRLANDVQEIILKLGKSSDIFIEKRSLVNPKWQDVYTISISKDKYAWWHNHNSGVTKIEKHNCRVTCLTVPNSIFLIRVNYKPIWTGNSIQSMGEARAKLMLMSMDYLGIRPLLKYMMVLNTFHLPSGFEYRITDREGQEGQNFGQIFGNDIHPDFDFAARYSAMEPALSKGVRAQQLVQMAQMWQQNPWINQYQMLKTTMELMDIQEADLLLKSPQQFMGEMQKQQKAQMMEQQTEQQAKQQLVKLKTQGKMAISQKDFTEEQALSEQDFSHDMALEAVKNEVANEG